MGFFRHLLPVAAAAAVGAALVYAAEKLVEKQEDEHIIDPDAFDDFDLYDEEDDTAVKATVKPQPAAETTENDDTEVDDKGWETVKNAADQAKSAVSDVLADAAPNENPVRDAAEPTPTTEDGKIDVEKLASTADFGNWEDVDCKG